MNLSIVLLCTAWHGTVRLGALSRGMVQPCRRRCAALLCVACIALIALNVALRAVQCGAARPLPHKYSVVLWSLGCRSWCSMMTHNTSTSTNPHYTHRQPMLVKSIIILEIWKRWGYRVVDTQHRSSQPLSGNRKWVSVLANGQRQQFF